MPRCCARRCRAIEGAAGVAAHGRETTRIVHEGLHPRGKPFRARAAEGNTRAVGAQDPGHSLFRTSEEQGRPAAIMP
jgi:hypothetical protein